MAERLRSSIELETISAFISRAFVSNTSKLLWPQFPHLKNGNYSTTLLVFLKEFQEMINVKTLAQCFLHGGHCECSVKIATFALFFSALCTVSLLSRPSKTVLLMSASRSRGARSVELQICLKKAQSFHSFCDTSYSSLAGDCWCFPKMKKS